MMSGLGGNPIFFNKKIKIGRPEHPLTPYTPTPITSHFCLTPPPPSLLPSKWTSYVYHPLYYIIYIILYYIILYYFELLRKFM